MSYSSTSDLDRVILAGADADAARNRIETLARLLDGAVRIPGTDIRVGADAVLNFVPGVGTLAAQGLSAWIVFEAHRLGVAKPTLLRMVGNVALDTVISSIPLVGWAGDIFFRANQRNLELLRRHLDGVVIDGEVIAPDPPRSGSAA